MQPLLVLHVVDHPHAARRCRRARDCWKTRSPAAPRPWFVTMISKLQRASRGAVAQFRAFELIAGGLQQGRAPAATSRGRGRSRRSPAATRCRRARRGAPRRERVQAAPAHAHRPADDRRTVPNRRRSSRCAGRGRRKKLRLIHWKSNNSEIAWRTRISAKTGRRVLKTKSEASLGRPSGNDLLDDASVAHRRNVIAGLPAGRILFAAHVIEPGLERLEIGVGVAIIIEAHFVEIP